MALQKFNDQDKRNKKERKDGEICLFLKIRSKSITKLDFLNKKVKFFLLASLARIFTEILPHMVCLAPTKFLAHYATAPTYGALGPNDDDTLFFSPREGRGW